MLPTIFYGNEWSDIFYAILHAGDLYTTYYIPPRVKTRHSARLQYPPEKYPSKISRRKETCRWRVSTRAWFIFPQLYPARPFRPKISRRKYPVEKRRAVGASLRVGDLYIPHLHAVDLYTTYYIHPEKYPPRKYPPRKISAPRRDAPFGTSPISPKNVSAIYIPHICMR